MTTTVRVQARAWGATVETNGETIELGANQERAFHVDEGQSQSFTVTHGTEPQDEEVPGRAQNDELLGQGRSSRRTTSAAPTGGESTGEQPA